MLSVGLVFTLRGTCSAHEYNVDHDTFVVVSGNTTCRMALSINSTIKLCTNCQKPDDFSTFAGEIMLAIAGCSLGVGTAHAMYVYFRMRKQHVYQALSTDEINF